MHKKMHNCLQCETLVQMTLVFITRHFHYALTECSACFYHEFKFAVFSHIIPASEYTLHHVAEVKKCSDPVYFDSLHHLPGLIYKVI